MNVKLPTYRVLLRFPQSDRQRWVQVHASTPALAAGMAEKMELGSEAVRVEAIYTITGRCGKCGSHIFNTDLDREHHGKRTCGNC